MSKRVEFDAATARILLDLAENRKTDVRTDSQGPRLSLIVTDELWERYEQYQGLQEDGPKERKGRKP